MKRKIGIVLKTTLALLFSVFALFTAVLMVRYLKAGDPDAPLVRLLLLFFADGVLSSLLFRSVYEETAGVLFPLTASARRTRRRTDLFSLFFMIYLAVCILILRGVDPYSSAWNRILQTEMLGMLAIVSAYILLIRQLNAAASLEKVQDPVLAKALRHSTDARFTLCAEVPGATLAGDGFCMVRGRLFGECKANDRVFLYLPDGTVLSAVIRKIMFDNPDEQVPSNRMTRLFITAQKPVDIPAYSVISSIMPPAGNGVNVPVENPLLLGLLLASPYLKRREGFAQVFARALKKSRFLICAVREKTPSNMREKISEGFFIYEGNYRFTSVRRSDTDTDAFPVYTDWDAYACADGEQPEGAVCEALVFTFDELLPMIRGNSLVINPFGPQSIFLSSRDVIAAAEGNTMELKDE